MDTKTEGRSTEREEITPLFEVACPDLLWMPLRGSRMNNAYGGPVREEPV